MKTILLFILIFSSINVYSQWEKLTYEPIIVTKPYAVNGDSVYVFRDKFGWFSSFDNGITWKLDKTFLRNKNEEYGDSYVGPAVQFFSPIFKDSCIYYYNVNFELLISTDYGKTFKKAVVKTSFNEEFLKLSELHKLVFDENSDIVYALTTFGLYISFDKGYNWHHKSSPGRWLVSPWINSKLQYENPEEVPGGLAATYQMNSLVTFDTTLVISGNMGNNAGSIHKTMKYDKNDSNNTIFFPITHEYFLKKYGSDEFYNSLNSFNLLKFKSKLYVIFADTWWPGGSDYSKIWTSKDEGITWEEQDYSNFGLDTIKEIKYCGDYLYAIQDAIGVFMSSDEGKTWELLNDGFQEIPDEQKSHLRFGNLNFTENYAYISNGWSLYRAPLEDCKIVTETSSVESTTTEPKIFPNPTSEIITISGIGLGKLELYNTLGQKLIEKEITGTTQLNTSDLQTGLYIIKLESGGEVIFEKVIVNR